jgi:hypothetical protein
MLLTGCFYIDPIVERAQVVGDVKGELLHDGEVIATATFQPESKGTFHWRARACSTKTDCDGDFLTSDADQFSFRVPTVRASGALVNYLLVIVEGHDDHGALSTDPVGNPIGDAAPELKLSVEARAFTITAPITIFANFSDAEYESEKQTLDLGKAITWTVSRDGTVVDDPLVDIIVAPPAIPEPTHVVVGKRLTTNVPGTYKVTATARDGTCTAGVENCNMVTASTRDFAIDPDHPPCLAQWRPEVLGTNQPLPISEPTVFEVPLVNDDLESFPQVSEEPPFGTTKFAWSMLRPGGTRELLTREAGNRIVFDPSAFKPGDIVELRVEVADRAHPTVTCPDSEPTCAMTSDATCLQRQTWRVEVR